VTNRMMIRKLDKSELPSDPATGTSSAVTSRTLADPVKPVKLNVNQVIDCASNAPICRVGGVAGLKDLLAPKGAIVKVAGMTKFQFSGSAQRFSALAAVEVIKINAVVAALDIRLSKAERETCRTAWIALPNKYQTGVLRTCADQVGPVPKGAVTDAGGKAEVVCYADI
jgi:dihydroxyacid dehydratase/phosphogluconate dehydratase